MTNKEIKEMAETNAAFAVDTGDLETYYINVQDTADESGLSFEDTTDALFFFSEYLKRHGLESPW